MNKDAHATASDFNSELKLKGFKVYKIDSKTGGHNYSRKDFYKISLTTGKYIFHLLAIEYILFEAVDNS